ncbi:uncharacterized protein LOC110243022 isoform X2 [Exaiptasia diaphana]|uniref:Uncharacterized protein n=1 Tax=Exaiptasia diaphana TaxID=2652724 RepID=A0A913XHZ3_EXADI|nr:uncharacterized protein LOC110243022 isoform X2 [Exaiptasia diaphana]
MNTIMREIMNDPLYASILHPEKIKTEENNSNQSTMDNDESQKLNTDHGNNISASQTDSTDISGKSCGSNCTADTDNARKISSSQCTSGTTVTSKTQDMSTQTLNYCKDCYRLKLTNYQQSNRIKSYQFKMKQKNATIMKLKRRVQKLELEKLGITKITAQPMVERTKGQLELIQLDHNYFG